MGYRPDERSGPTEQSAMLENRVCFNNSQTEIDSKWFL